MTRRELVINLLTLVADGALDPQTALEQWGDVELETDVVAARAWHELSHLANDSDLAACDAKYVAHMRNVLRGYARQLAELP